MKICILNGSNPNTIQLESDVYVDYRQGRASCFQGQTVVKKCNSWHSWPYALETEFFVYNKDGWQGCFKYDAIVLLVNRDPGDLIPLVKKLKLMKKKVAISFHEGVQDLVGGSGLKGEDIPQRWIGLYNLVKEAGLYVNIFGQMTPFFEGWFGKDVVKYASHGAPMDWNHGFTVPWEERSYDILVGTRSFRQWLNRNTLVSIATLNGIAKEKGYNLHFLSEDGDVRPLLQRIGLGDVTVHQGPFVWTDWLQFLSQFRVIAHFDHSLNLGQICYEAAMVDVIPVGSTTWNNIQIGTDDHASTDQFKDNVLDAFTRHPYWSSVLDSWKQTISPNTVRDDIFRIFE